VKNLMTEKLTLLLVPRQYLVFYSANISDMYIYAAIRNKLQFSYIKATLVQNSFSCLRELRTRIKVNMNKDPHFDHTLFFICRK
jgi:hypothetical protein